ncbi:MAG: hypothetical protein SVR94_17330, partial [Pseudomonadota bacterium]|nr:hypothetical protein [Pseudomonadota bacterium]
MSVKDMLEVVSKCTMFKEFNNKEKYYILRFFKKENFETGDVVIHEGQEVKELCIVASGRWEVFLPKIYRTAEIK